MNTPTHLIFAAAVFAKPEQRKVTIAALLGGFIPDLSLYLMIFWHQFVLGTPTNVIFGQLYFSPYWQQVFAIDNSFILWGLALIAALIWKNWLSIVFCASAFAHLLMDFPLHNDDARAHFWPLTMWKFESPVSYWDSNHHGNIVAVLEILLVCVLLGILWRRFQTIAPRILLLIAGLTTVAPFLVFGILMQVS